MVGVRLLEIIAGSSPDSNNYQLSKTRATFCLLVFEIIIARQIKKSRHFRFGLACWTVGSGFETDRILYFQSSKPESP